MTHSLYTRMMPLKTWLTPVQWPASELSNTKTHGASGSHTDLFSLQPYVDKIKPFTLCEAKKKKKKQLGFATGRPHDTTQTRPLRNVVPLWLEEYIWTPPHTLAQLMPTLFSAHITCIMHFTWFHMQKLPMTVVCGGGLKAGFGPFCKTSRVDLTPNAFHGTFHSELYQH